MVHSPDKENKKPVWFKHKKALNQVLFSLRRQSLTPLPKPLFQVQPATKTYDFPPNNLIDDKISLCSDEILLKILSRTPTSQMKANSLVSKRWLNLQGRLVRSIKLLDWEFLVSGRLLFRFPNLTHVNLVNGCLISPRNCGISCSHRIVSFHVGSDLKGSKKEWFLSEDPVLTANEVDKGLKIMANGCPNLRKLVVINCSELGLLSVAEECSTLQELELHMCNDKTLRGIAACQNLQILRLSGIVDGLYGSLVSDNGLTILAQGCKRLLKLELGGCKGSYEGIRAIGQCCQMLEELTLCNHKMENGWLLALLYCENLKSLMLSSCERIDSGYGVDEDLECLAALESLRVEKCQLRDKNSLRALFHLCRNVREVVLKNCWGLDDEMFYIASEFRRVKCVCLEGCSLLTTRGLELVIVNWNEMESLKVKSCNNIKDNEVNPELCTVFSTLKDLTWKADTKSHLSANLSGSGMGKRGNKFFKKSSYDWKSLPGS